MAKIDKGHHFFDQLTYIHTQYWHFLNLKSISFNFCSYTFFRLKPHYGVMLKFSWNLDHFPPKIDKEHKISDYLTYIYSQYGHFLNLILISFNFCSYTFFWLRPRYGVFLKFCWNSDHFPPKIDKEHNFFGTKVVRNWF